MLRPSCVNPWLWKWLAGVRALTMPTFAMPCPRSDLGKPGLLVSRIGVKEFPVDDAADGRVRR